MTSRDLRSDAPADMVERVAQALHRANSESGRRLYNSGAFEALDRFEREHWLFSARAAIEAMREPNEAMLAAARYADDNLTKEAYRQVISEMIDAALSSAKQTETSSPG